MHLCIFEDGGVGDLGPLTLTRPAFDLRCGAGTLLERQRRLLPGAEGGALVRPPLAGLCRLEHPELAVNEPDFLHGQRVLFVNARWLPPVEPVALPQGGGVGLVGDEVAFAVVDVDADAALAGWPWRTNEWKDMLPTAPAGGQLFRHAWDMVGANGAALADDFRLWVGHRPDTVAQAGLTVVGPADRLRVAPSAVIEPQVVFDTRNGPVLIDDGVSVQAFSRVEGPCCVGAGSQVLGGRLRGGTTVGPDCRVGGEVEASILLAHVNKYHDGFVGHSYLGEWVNFGAGTQTSDLRNDYGPIQMLLDGRKVDTGLLKLGAYLGDFTRTGIGTLLNTGTLTGPFGQLLPSGTYLPRFVPPFCTAGNGRVQERTDLREMFATAATVMGRRGRQWTPTHADFYFDLYERTEAERRRSLRDAEQRRIRRMA